MSLKALAIAAIAAAAVGLVATTVSLTVNTAYQRGFGAGSDKVTTERDAKDLARAGADNRKLLALINRADQLQDELSQQDQANHQEKTHAQAENQRLRAALRNGAVRLSIPTTAAQCVNHAGPESSGPAGEPDQARTELDPATSEAVVAITDDGDDAIRDLNTCIDRYNTVARAQNAPLAPSLDR
jgi:hypothetical protein